MQSLRVPGVVLQHLVRVVHWSLPYAVAGLWALLGGGFGWIESRPSRKEMGDKVGDAVALARAAQTDAHTGSSLARDHAKELRAIWIHIVDMEAELKVWREHSRLEPEKRNQLIQEAKGFYERELTTQLKEHADDPGEAVRLALLARWRP